ncbi:MAG TPA: response regulator [Bacteroidia bacterium]|nr:response regulator [Bacteroidia bacterium]
MSLFSRSILIVEDEIAVSMDIEMRLKKLGYTITGTAMDAEEAVRLLEETPPDLVLLDIQLGKSLDGLKLSKLLKERGFTVVFLTAFADNATFAQALATEPAGYVLKPFRDDDLQRTIEIALKKQEQEQPLTAVQDSGSFFIREKGQLLGINYDDLLWFEALDNYVRIHTTRKTHTVKISMKDIEQKLPASQFIRVHRSFIIPISRISRIEENTIYIDKDSIPIGGQYREKLMQRLRVL